MNSLPIVISNITIRQDSEGRYCLNDLHKAAGSEKKHTPNRFIRIAQTKELITEIEQTPDMAFDNSPVKCLNSIQGGKTPGTYACKEIVYAYAMWISASFNLKVIRAYDKLINTPPTISDTELSAEQMKQINAIINAPKPTIETRPLPDQQQQEIIKRINDLCKLFNPLSTPYSNALGIIRILKGLDPKIGIEENGYIRVITIK